MTLDNAAVVLTLVGGGIFALRTAIFLLGYEREQAKAAAPSLPLPSVSVVVPARNEESSIEHCVRSLMQSDYPAELWELIVVDDESEDSTAAVLERLRSEFPRLKVAVTRGMESGQGLRGKTRALHAGILKSDAEVVMMTDADCTVHPRWVSVVAESFRDTSVDLIASFTVIRATSFFSLLQSLEWIYNHTLASAGVGWRQPLGCFGNNLSIRRSAYNTLGGYPAIPFSVTEDLALLQAANRANLGIRYPCREELQVTTLPVENFDRFIRQHRRWAVGGKALGWRATIFVASSVAFWAGLISSALALRADLFLLLIAMRILLDAEVLRRSTKRLSQGSLLPLSPLGTIFFLFLEAIIPFLILKTSVTWKGRTY